LEKNPLTISKSISETRSNVSSKLGWKKEEEEEEKESEKGNPLAGEAAEAEDNPLSKINNKNTEAIPLLFSIAN